MSGFFRDEDYNLDERNPNEWDYFEALDRTSTVMAMFERLLYNHIGLTNSEAVLAREISSKLFELYQSIGLRAL